MGEKVTKKLNCSKEMVEELRADARYEVVSEKQIGEDDWAIEVQYEKADVQGGAAKQSKGESVEVSGNERMLRKYIISGYKVVSMTRSGKMVNAVLER